MKFNSILFLNLPPKNGVPFARGLRCQEREKSTSCVRPPITLINLASICRDNKVDFLFLDATSQNLRTSQEISLKIKESKFNPNIIITSTSTCTINFDLEILQKIRYLFPKSFVFIIGAHPTILYQEILDLHPHVSGVFIGEPEQTMIDILKKYHGTLNESIKGLIFKKNAALKGIAEFNEVDLNAFSPGWKLLQHDSYKLPIVNEKFISIEVNRGCPFKCSFCVVPIVHGIKFREKSIHIVIKEIENAINLGIQYINFLGDTLTLNKKYMTDLCNKIIEEKLNFFWFGNARVDTLLDEKLVEKLKQSGCFMLGIGIESYSSKTIDDVNKKISIDQVKIAIANLKKNGIKSFGFFILGIPGETKQDMRQTIDFAANLDLDFASFPPAVPYPGTLFYDKCNKNNWIVTNDWDKYEYSNYVLNDGILNDKIVKRYIKYAYLKFYASPKRIKAILVMCKNPIILLNDFIKNFTKIK